MNDTSGYTVSYDADEAPFPFYLAAILSVIFTVAAFATGYNILLMFAIVAFALSYYNFPLAETKRPCLGANQYGIFVQDLGLISWRAIDKLELVEIAVRVLTKQELQIVLKQPLRSALVADWRKVPWYRNMMRIPWKMTLGNVICVNLEPMDHEPAEVHRTLQRMWRHYRS